MKAAPTIWNSNRAMYGEPAVMTADWAFVKQLKALDQSLDVVWNRLIERWIIIERGKETGRWHVVARVENPDGTYRGLDNRLIREMIRTKWYFDKGSKAFSDRIEAEETAEITRQWKDYENEIHSIGDWYALQMMGIPQIQVPKGYSHEKGREANRQTDSNIESNASSEAGD